MNNRPALSFFTRPCVVQPFRVRLAATALSLAASFLCARPLAAQEPPSRRSDTSPAPPAGAAPPATVSRWYGWQTLVTDGAAIGLVTGGIVLDEASHVSSSVLADGVIGLGVASYALGGPIVHFAHRNPGRAFASLALRIGLPIILGYGAIAIICGDSGEFCGLVAIPGGALGIATAITLDASVLARDQVPVNRAAFSIVPTLRVDRERASIGLIGTF